jgi:hypothetical protein
MNTFIKFTVEYSPNHAIESNNNLLLLCWLICQDILPKLTSFVLKAKQPSPAINPFM